MSAHDHTHALTHAPTHAHTHEEDNYYLDQLCMVTMSAAFGGICLAMYFWRTKMLWDMLGPQFHPFVLVSGITLIVLAVFGAGSLWVQVGRDKGHHHHDHGHDHGGHGHGDACHDHGPDCGHSHAQEHATTTHAHDHGQEHHHHDHGPEDHDHAWAPWRYVVLLLPVLLFLIGLPSKGRQAEAASTDFTKYVVAEAVGLVNPGSTPWSSLAYVGYLSKDQVGEDVTDFDFKNLAAAVGAPPFASSEESRRQWKDKAVRVIGQYAPSRQSDREFRLVRFKISCCANDAIQLELPIISRESIADIPKEAWVRVTGRVEYRKRRDEVVPVIVVSGRKAVQPCPPDLNPYVQ